MTANESSKWLLMTTPLDGPVVPEVNMMQAVVVASMARGRSAPSPLAISSSESTTPGSARRASSRSPPATMKVPRPGQRSAMRATTGTNSASSTIAVTRALVTMWVRMSPR